MNFEKGLKEQCLFSLQQTEGRYNSFPNVNAFYEENTLLICRGKENKIYTMDFHNSNEAPGSVT